MIRIDDGLLGVKPCYVHRVSITIAMQNLILITIKLPFTSKIILIIMILSCRDSTRPPREYKNTS